jgi:hypothetical protein
VREDVALDRNETTLIPRDALVWDGPVKSRRYATVMPDFRREILESHLTLFSRNDGFIHRHYGQNHYFLNYIFLNYFCSEPLRSDRRNLTRRFRALSYRR